MATNALQTVKAKIIGAASDVLALPATLRANRVARQANTDAVAIKTDRASGGNPIPPDPKSPAFQARTLANDARYRRSQQS